LEENYLKFITEH